MIQAALFDMDGLLFDSERIHMLAGAHSARLLGYTFTREMSLATLGMNDQMCNEYFARFNPGYDGDAFWAHFHGFLHDYALDPGMPLKPWAREILQSLHARGVGCALVTSSPLAEAQLYLETRGLSPYLPCIVSGDLGLPSKPAPDVFLRGAELLHADIARCAVLEDSPGGLRAGRAAGAVTVMVPDLIPFSEELRPLCDFVAPTLREAEEFLCR